jgi:Flp pilus assembly pilin Flp
MISFWYLSLTGNSSEDGMVRGELKMNHLSNVWNQEEGQDLIEYSLLISFVALAVVGMFMGAGGDVKGVWASTNGQLSLANTHAS